jgi:hypothetical protein
MAAAVCHCLACNRFSIAGGFSSTPSSANQDRRLFPLRTARNGGESCAWPFPSHSEQWHTVAALVNRIAKLFDRTRDYFRPGAAMNVLSSFPSSTFQIRTAPSK